MTDFWFPVEITEEERGFGFRVTVDPFGNRTLAVADLGGDLRAVKVRGHVGKANYLVCDDRLAPRQPVARSIEELRTRFPRQ